MITDSWARCRFEEQQGASEDEESGAVAVVDRASGQTLGVYPSAASGVVAGLGSVLPAEA